MAAGHGALQISLLPSALQYCDRLCECSWPFQHKGSCSFLLHKPAKAQLLMLRRYAGITTCREMKLCKNLA